MMNAPKVATIVAIVGMWGCSEWMPRNIDFGEEVVATAFGEDMTWDSLSSAVPDDLSLADSAAFAERILTKWMREQVMLDAARMHLKEELPSLEAALEAYRRSLLINTYETRYVESRLDMDVSEEEIEAYHRNHPELFTLHDHAVRALFLHFPEPQQAVEAAGGKWSKKDGREWQKDRAQVENWLMSADSVSIPELERWCIEHGAVHHIDHEMWWSIGELIDEVPLSLYRVEEQIQRTFPLSFVEGDRIYFLRFLDHGLKGKTAPIEVARDQIIELILQSRRQKLREALRDTLYQQAWADGSLQRENL